MWPCWLLLLQGLCPDRNHVWDYINWTDRTWENTFWRTKLYTLQYTPCRRNEVFCRRTLFNPYTCVDVTVSAAWNHWLMVVMSSSPSSTVTPPHDLVMSQCTRRAEPLESLTHAVVTWKREGGRKGWWEAHFLWLQPYCRESEFEDVLGKQCVCEENGAGALSSL
jgi:hypothetical protein